MKVAAIIEARMGSTRLPGKVMLEIAGKPTLYHLVRRLKAVSSLDEIVIATTKEIADDAIFDFSKNQGIKCFRGSEEDVLGRVIDAAESVRADVIVEVTGDCTLIDPDLVEQTIRVFLRNKVDYAANSFISSYPDGMDTQVFLLDALRRSGGLTNDPLDREHVTRHIVNHPDLFSHLYLIAPPSLHWPGLGLTLDEPRDFELISKIINYFGEEEPYFSCLDVIKLLRANPDWLEINDDVKRKNLRPT